VRGIYRRNLRLEFAAAIAMALAGALAPAAWGATQSIATQTTLNVATSDVDGRTQATASVSVSGEDGQPATGAVSIEEGNRTLAEVALDGVGHASTTFSIPGGNHLLRAVYTGDEIRLASSSPVTEATGTPTAAPGFQVSLTPVSPASFPMTLAQGTAGTAEVTITPVNNSSLTAPMFVTLSCSGLPNYSSCTFTPESVEIVAATPASCTTASGVTTCPPVSSMLVQTQAQGRAAKLERTPGKNSVAWALLLPGVLGLGGLAWSARRRAWLNRLALVALVGLVMTLGATGCNPQYYYYNHGPPPNPPTPTGTYTIIVTAQSNNGVTAISNFTTMVLTVK
jgi:hypothetical protein